MSKFIANSFQLPNAFVDEMLCKLSGNACKIYLLIVRKTRGWHKEADRISYSQIQKSTGLNSRTTISKALDELIDLGLIIKEQGSQKSSNEYKLNDDFCTAEDEQPSPKNGLYKNCTSPKNGPASPKNGQEPSPKNGHTEIHYIKNTRIKNNSVSTHEPISRKTQSVDNGILEKSKSKTTKPKITFEPPSDLRITDNQFRKCLENGLDVNDQLERFKIWALSKGQGYANWSMAFSNWINRSIEFKARNPQPQTPQTYDQYGNLVGASNAHQPNHQPHPNSTTAYVNRLQQETLELKRELYPERYR
ncbi:replication protein [Moraxella bovoculi]|uniref:replication protein n=1 Tax=Moraxella bovoculi TaxID=386891 RepID=UPI0009BADF26|nr:replication protein [Moraxella bovoculi]